MHSDPRRPAAPSFWLRALPLLLCGALLAAGLADTLWNESVDLAHHYALVARLMQHWVLPLASDPSLGEMNVYPRASHVLAALVGRIAGSPLLGLQLTANAATIAIWAVLLLFLRQLPARAAVASALALGALLWLNGQVLLLEIHGGELLGNFFYAQLTAQAGALLAMLAALRMERAGLPAWWRYLLLLAAIGVLCGVHLMPALELLAVLGLCCAMDLLPPRARSPRAAAPRASPLWALPAMLAPPAGALLLVQHPGFAVMRSISKYNGSLPVNHLDSTPLFGLYAGVVLLLSLVMLHSWRQAPAGERARQALGLKYIGLYGAACALMCLLQLLALAFNAGSDYAVKKYVYGLHTALLLELCMVPALLLAWHRTQALHPTPARQLAWAQAAALLSPPLLALAVLMPLSQRPPSADTSSVVRVERQLIAVRDLRLAEPPGRYTYVARLDGVSPIFPYLFSIGVFGVPRDGNAENLLAGGVPANLGRVGHLLTGETLAAAQPYARCRRADSPSGLALLDGSCLEAEISPPGQHISLADDNQAMPCTLSGFSAPEQNGRWSNARTALIACPVPKLIGGGKPPTVAVLATQAFLQQLPLQRLDISVNGGAPTTFRYDAATPARLLELPLPPGAAALTLTLSLPDARTPRSLGLGTDERALGVMIRSVSFH